MHPAVYTGVARQISRTTGTELPAIEATTVLLSAVARDLFRTDISWAKVIGSRRFEFDTDSYNTNN